MVMKLGVPQGSILCPLSYSLDDESLPRVDQYNGLCVALPTYFTSSYYEAYQSQMNSQFLVTQLGIELRPTGLNGECTD